MQILGGLTSLTYDDLIYIALFTATLMLVGITLLVFAELGKKSKHSKEKVAVLLVRPDEVELKDKGVILTSRGDLVVREGNDLLVYKIPENVKPYSIRVGKTKYNVYIVDSRREVFYTIPDEIEELNEEIRSTEFNPVFVDPRTLANYVASKSVERLLKPMRASPTEVLMFMSVGGLLVVLLIFFVLPLLGYQVSIGGGGIFG